MRRCKCFILLISTCVALFSCVFHRLDDQRSYELIPIVETISEFIDTFDLDSEISPYRDSLIQEMSVVIAFADTNFVPERPRGTLNDWVAQAVLENQTKNVRLSVPVMCLLNFGGLRSTINKGAVTLGDIYKVSPFDNKVVWVTLPWEVRSEISQYLTQSGGEPIAGVTFNNGQLTFNDYNIEPSEFIVITSDFLANGGDKMYFFQKATEIIHTDKFLRDCLIEEAKLQRHLRIITDE